MIGTMRALLNDEGGGAIVEYALVLALVSVIGMSALYEFGWVLSKYFNDSSTSLDTTAMMPR